jgi:hypothetical protein
MTKNVARQMLRAAFGAGAELQGLLGVLKKECTADEYQSYARGIAAAIDGITVAVTNKVLAAHPDLANEIESNLKRSGYAM